MIVAPATRPRRPILRRLQARLFRVVNVPMRIVLGLPFATPLSGRLMLVHLTGRRTGKAYHQPVSYVREGEYLLSPGGGAWKLNLTKGEPVQIRLAGRDITARPELVQNLDEVERLLGVMMAANPAVSAFVGIPRQKDRTLNRARLELAVRFGFRIVRWRIGEAGADGSAAPAEGGR